MAPGHKAKPPEELLRPCPVPDPGLLSRAADLLTRILQLEDAIRACDADKTSLREWAAKE